MKQSESTQMTTATPETSSTTSLEMTTDELATYLGWEETPTKHRDRLLKEGDKTTAAIVYGVALKQLREYAKLQSVTLTD
jgi:hypothetical protein